MTKWTPGEWRITNQGERIDKQYTHQIGTHEQTVCYTFEPGTDPDEQQANARLICSAPELYEALEKTRRYIDSMSLSGPRTDKIMDQIDAILAKARNES